MNFLQRFEQYLSKECRVSSSDRVLIAVSGGSDSMCLLHLLIQLRMDIAIVHCNFQLRGHESDEDENFVRQQAEKYSIPCFVKKFNTSEYAQITGVSIQEAARELRYAYFEQIRQTHRYQWVATAHHADDSIETFFINLIRGTGLKGITGIKPINQTLIRPLLFAFRNEIEQYCNENQIPFRTDSSNFSDKYLRNYLRHHIIPAFEQLNPAFRSTMLRNMANFQQAAKIYQHYVSHELNPIAQYQPDGLITLSIKKITEQPSPSLALLELLQPFGFSPDTCNEIFRTLEGETGKEFFSTTHRLVRDRDQLVIAKKTDDPNVKFYIEKDVKTVTQPIHLNLMEYNASDYTIKDNPNIAALDADKIAFPLLLRHWQKGDYFIPLGMKNFKKLSDFFIDLKLSRIHKDRLWILANGQDIVWIVGLRIDDRYKLTPKTKRVLEIHWEQ